MGAIHLQAVGLCRSTAALNDADAVSEMEKLKPRAAGRRRCAGIARCWRKRLGDYDGSACRSMTESPDALDDVPSPADAGSMDVLHA